MGGADLGSYTQEQLVGKIIGTCPETEVVLGNVPLRCLIDTGAEVSTVTEAFFREHLAPSGQEMLDTTTWLRITAANGTTIPYLGYIEADVTICGHVFTSSQTWDSWCRVSSRILQPIRQRGTGSKYQESLATISSNMCMSTAHHRLARKKARQLQQNRDNGPVGPQCVTSTRVLETRRGHKLARKVKLAM